MNKPLILVVEDDAPVRKLITTTLKAHDYKFITAQNGNNAIMEASSHNPDIVLLISDFPIWTALRLSREYARGRICRSS